MEDFRSVYRYAEENTTAILVVLFALLLGLLALETVFSGVKIMAVVAGLIFICAALARPLWMLGFLAVYIPFEPFLLKFIPDDIYVYVRYFSEILIYALVFATFWKILNREAKLRQTPADLPFVLFVVVAIASAVINFVDPEIAILGLRQILRFILIFFVSVYLAPSTSYIKKLTMAMFGIVLFQAGLGILQAIIGAPLDNFLLPSGRRTFGDITLTSGVVQFWDPGSRVFATMGRYDQLGTFLTFFLLMATAFVYQASQWKKRAEIFWVFLLGLPALILTYSRSAWFGFVLGFLFISLWIKRDKKVMLGTLVFMLVISSYLAYSGLVVRYLTDVPSQSVVERFFEAFSYERWRGEYYGLGRVFWMVQTVTVVVPASPIFGFGPGQYGGGANSALGNTKVYDELGLPYGVYGSEGYIDNNWFSLWGETGTLGLLMYVWMYLAIFFYAVKVYRKSKDPFVKSLGLGFAACMVAVVLHAFLATFLEVRTLAFYLWLFAGFIVVLGQREKVRL